MKRYTYLHRKADTNEIFYVGKGSGNRMNNMDPKRSQRWWNTVNKHGFIAEKVAEWDTHEEAYEHERFLIACFRDMGIKLVNHTIGGDGARDLDEESKLKRSESLKEANKRPEVIANRKAGGEKMAKTHSEVMTKKWKDPDYRKKRYDAHIIGNSAPEVVAKRRSTQKKRLENPENNPAYLGPVKGTNKKTGEVIILRGNREMKAAGFQPSNIHHCLTGKLKSTGGYTWSR